MVDIYNQFKDFKSFEVIYKNVGEPPQKIFASVHSIENNCIIIHCNNAINKDKVAQVGTELQLHIYTENGIYSSTSHILGRTKGSTTTEYIIAYPAHSKHSQRREYFRAEIQIDFNMEIFLDDEGFNKYLLSGKTRNICGKGMSFISNKPFVEYNEIEIELKFPERIIKTSAQLVYTQTAEIARKQVFIHAFTFPEISQKYIDFIVKKCFLFQLDLKKRPI